MHEAQSVQVRIVVPAYASMASLPGCLAALERCDVGWPCERVVVDDGGNPGLTELARRGCFRVLQAHRRNASLARNSGVADFEGDVIVFVDADVKVGPSALAMLLAPILSGDADATYGNYSTDGAGLNFYQRYKQAYVARIYGRRSGYVSDFFWTAVCAIRRSAFKSVGGFDPDLPRHIGEDVELGQRLTRAGYRIMNVPGAQGKHLKRYSLRSLVANDFWKGADTVYLSLVADAPLSHNPHATGQDMAAVLSSAVALCGLASATALALPMERMLLVLFSFLPYLTMRCEFVALQLRQGLAFALRSVPLMYLLDLVRILSVASGVALFLWRGWALRARSVADVAKPWVR